MSLSPQTAFILNCPTIVVMLFGLPTMFVSYGTSTFLLLGSFSPSRGCLPLGLNSPSLLGHRPPSPFMEANQNSLGVFN